MPKLLRISLLLLLLPAWFMAGMHGYHAKKQVTKPQTENYHIAESTSFGAQATESNGLSPLSFKPAPPVFPKQAILHCFAAKTAITLHSATSAFHALKPLLFAPVFIRICVLRI